MKKPVKERVIEQPCCGCILFRECGTITRTTPDNCKKRMTVEEFGHIPIKMSKEMFIERSKEIFGDDTFDYSRLEYINIETPVELYCNIHKVWFKVIPEKHLCRH